MISEVFLALYHQGVLHNPFTSFTDPWAQRRTVFGGTSIIFSRVKSFLFSTLVPFTLLDFMELCENNRLKSLNGLANKLVKSDVENGAALE